MPDEKSETQPTETKSKKAPAPSAKEAAETVAETVTEPPVRNLTREGVEGFLVSRAIADGKDPGEAAAHAKKRAAQMVSDD